MKLLQRSKNPLQALKTIQEEHPRANAVKREQQRTVVHLMQDEG